MIYSPEASKSGGFRDPVGDAISAADNESVIGEFEIQNFSDSNVSTFLPINSVCRIIGITIVINCNDIPLYRTKMRG